MPIGWVELAEADAYLAVKPGGQAFIDLSDADETAYLTQAYREIVYDVRFSFPDPAEDPMKFAQIEYAFALFGGGGVNKRRDLQAQGVVEFQVGSFRERFRESKDAPAGFYGYGAADKFLQRYETGIPVVGTVASRSREDRAIEGLTH